MITLYGIASCDSCRKARKWLATAGIAHEWIDVRADGVDRDRLARWHAVLGTDSLLNKRSKIWRDFDEREREQALAEPVAVLVDHPTLIKRPILETGTDTLAGFSPARYETALAGPG